jgi:lysophospholipase L1-like esterase
MSRSSARLSGLLLVLAALAHSSCGGSNKTPIQPGSSALGITCPSSLFVEATRREGAAAAFDLPLVRGGRAPYTTTCAPAPGTVFPMGGTTVSCTVADADMAQASCQFRLTVRVSRALARTRFLAFGDSITWGQISLAPLIRLDAPDTYPWKLEQMLVGRYPLQTFAVLNHGWPGETTPRGAARLPSVLDADRPEVMLLLEGVNNVRGLSTSTQVASLRSMISAARQRGVEVIIATVMAITPEREARQPGTMAAIGALNTRIFELAAEYGLGAPVDLLTLFETNPALIGADGLHPTLEGQTRIAEAFRDAIIQRYENAHSASRR